MSNAATAAARAAALDPKRIPTHIACVMDGNGRWAQRRGLKRTEGHAAGEEALWDVVQTALDLGVKWLTVYAFSTENWRRPVDEVRFLMNFNREILQRRKHHLHSQGVRIRFAGRRDWHVPRKLLREQDESMSLTQGNRTMTLTFAFNYGGRAEIIDAVKRMIDDGVKSGDVNEKLISRYCYFPDMPDPELMVRTSGEFRISNFLLWELAYSELVFTPVLWPDFRGAHLIQAIKEYQDRNRRFGGIDTGSAPESDPEPERFGET